MHSQWRSDLNMLNSREKEVKKKGKTPTTCPKSRSEDSTSPATRGTPEDVFSPRAPVPVCLTRQVQRGPPRVRHGVPRRSARALRGRRGGAEGRSEGRGRGLQRGGIGHGAPNGEQTCRSFIRNVASLPFLSFGSGRKLWSPWGASPKPLCPGAVLGPPGISKPMIDSRRLPG